MKLDDKIRIRRVAYLLKGEISIAFKLATLYYILAKRRTSGNKISDAFRKSVQWLKKAKIEISNDITQLELSEQLELLEKVLVRNKAVICQKTELSAGKPAALVRAIPVFNRDFGLAYVNS